jgi:cyclophilin family peptidyl-prolyl cis-trans isomerase
MDPYGEFKMKRLSTLFLIAMSALAQTPAAPPKKDAATAAPARENGLYAIFNTSMGTFTAKLFENETPVTVKNFVALAKGTKAWKDPNTHQMVTKPLYNGVTFHRVIKGFMIQTGDPTARGDHDCGFTIKDEILPSLKFDQPFLLGMANIGSPNSGGCQFFVTAVPTPHLNGMHTIFGKVIEGTDIVTNIDNVRTGPGDKPITPVKIVTLTIQRVGPAPAAPAPVKKSTGTATKSGITPKK